MTDPSVLTPVSDVAAAELATTDRTSKIRPWGAWHILEAGPGYKIKRLDVRPGHRLSYQVHAHREETWVVVFGMATCVVNGQTFKLGPGETITVPQGAAHRIVNGHSEPLMIVEVQRGGYTGEDDILRIDDEYGRSAC